MQDILSFLPENWALIWALFVTIVFCILSELLAFKPILGSSGVFKLIYSVSKGLYQRAEPKIEKLVEAEVLPGGQPNISTPPQPSGATPAQPPARP